MNKVVALWFALCKTGHMNKVLDKWIADSGLTQTQVAELFSLSKGMVSLLRSGGRRPSSDKRIEIEAATRGAVSFKDWPPIK